MLKIRALDNSLKHKFQTQIIWLDMMTVHISLINMHVTSQRSANFGWTLSVHRLIF